jgi:hypothetical protein
LSDPALTSPVAEYVKDSIWLKRYPVRFAGMNFSARSTLIRLLNGDLLVHSPSPIDDELIQQIAAIGRVEHIVAPGNYHYFYVSDWQRSYPDAWK